SMQQKFLFLPELVMDDGDSKPSAIDPLCRPEPQTVAL
ncbi:uncharacterized, partial [Tachysurus ichikawai]